MFARMTVLQIKPETIGDAIKVFRTSVIPEAKKQRGYRGSCLLIDRRHAQGKAVTFWRHERDAIANEENRYYQEQLIKFLSMFAAPPSREGYEVVIHAIGVPNKKRTKAAPPAGPVRKKAQKRRK